MRQKLFSKSSNFHLLRKKILFYCYLIIFKITGLAPWRVNVSRVFDSYNDQNNKQIYLCQVSNYEFLYNVLLIISMSAYLIILYTSSVWELIYIHASTMGIIGKALIILGALVSIIVWFVYILRQQVIVDIINELYRINNNLKGWKYYELKNRYFIYFIFIGNFILCCLILLIGIVTHVFVSITFWSIPCILISWCLMQYTLILVIIHQYITCLNDMILKLGNIDTNIKFEKLFVTKTRLREEIIMDIININYVNKKLCKITNDVANFYAIPILSAIIYFATTTIYELRYLILSVTTKNYGTIPRVLMYIDSVSWIIIVLFDLVALTTSVTRTTREVIIY